MEHISDRIKEAMDKRGMNQSDLSKASGVDKGSLSRYLAKKVAPKRNAIAKIAQALHVSPAWLLGMPVPMTLTSAVPVEETTVVPVLGTVAAGRPMYAEENIIGTEQVAPHLGSGIFALQIHGSSMEPKISDGDVVIVRQQPDAENGQYVIALVGDEEAVCKRFMRYEDGTIALLSLNPSFSPMVFPKSTADQVMIIGVVLESRSRFV